MDDAFESHLLHARIHKCGVDSGLSARREAAGATSADTADMRARPTGGYPQNSPNRSYSKTPSIASTRENQVTSQPIVGSAGRWIPSTRMP